MDIAEIRAKKSQLKQEIDLLIWKFNKDTDTIVSYIDLEYERIQTLNSKKEEAVFCGSKIEISLK